jgi:FAD/FMN-containing dehydrogenase
MPAKLSHESDVLERFSVDFGNLVRREPTAVARPVSIDDVAALVVRARELGVRIVARGQGHSVFGQSQIREGWVIDTSLLNQVRVDGNIAIVGPGSSWRDVLQTTLPHGLAPPVLTDYLGLSVGGTLSVGGFGGTSFRFGTQTDQVLDLTVVTGGGQVLSCSPHQATDLYDAIRGGLGQCGIIAQAQLPLVQVPPRLRLYQMQYASVEALTSALDRIATEARFDQLYALVRIDRSGAWRFEIHAVSHLFDSEPDDAALLSDLAVRPTNVATLDSSYLEYATRRDSVVAGWRASAIWKAPRAWVDVIVPAHGLTAFARSVVESLGPDDVGSNGKILLYPVATAQTRTPLLPVPRTSDRAYLFDVLRCTPGASEACIEALIHSNRSIYEQALAIGGSLYSISAVPMSRSDWERHFGPHWNAFAAAKLRHDPDAVLGGDLSIFPTRD